MTGGGHGTVDSTFGPKMTQVDGGCTDVRSDHQIWLQKILHKYAIICITDLYLRFATHSFSIARWNTYFWKTFIFTSQFLYDHFHPVVAHSLPDGNSPFVIAKNHRMIDGEKWLSPMICHRKIFIFLRGPPQLFIYKLVYKPIIPHLNIVICVSYTNLLWNS